MPSVSNPQNSGTAQPSAVVPRPTREQCILAAAKVYASHLAQVAAHHGQDVAA